MTKEERVQAIHLLVDEKIRDKAKDAIIELYSSNSTEFTLGITINLVPEVGNYTDLNMAAKCQELWVQQQAFMANMKTGAYWEIGSLDYPSSKHKCTLRELIMYLFKFGTAPDRPLFHSVDRRDVCGPVKFCFHLDNIAEAHATIASIIPMLWHYFQSTYKLEDNGISKLSLAEATTLAPLLYRFFTPRAVTQSFEIEWDPISGTGISQNDV